MKTTTRYLAYVATVFFCTAAFATPAERGRLLVGAARVDITPPINPQYPPLGKYEHEHLYVRAIVLDKV